MILSIYLIFNTEKGKGKKERKKVEFIYSRQWL